MAIIIVVYHARQAVHQRFLPDIGPGMDPSNLGLCEEIVPLRIVLSPVLWHLPGQHQYSQDYGLLEVNKAIMGCDSFVFPTHNGGEGVWGWGWRWGKGFVCVNVIYAPAR